MGAFEIIVIILEALCSIALIGVVLMQSGKEAGLSGAMTGASESYMNKHKSNDLDQKLAASTKWIAAAWLVLTLVLSFF